jgi:hypothetical protein
MASPMTPSPALQFVDGHPLASAGLLPWLRDQQARGTTLRLPVVVDFGGPFRLGVQRAWLGSDVADPGADALLLELDDTPMSVGLMDHLRTACPEGDRCAVWVEGRWGALVPMPPEMAAFADDPPRLPVSVTRFGGVASSPATHVQVAR